MYLEKLEIQGFKSFANKNKLVFSGLIDDRKRGLTAVVGPNGSGKSNVADAIRWALGEQSLKTLRGKKSEDVIFSGSDQKSQLGMAEVSLYLNNSEVAKGKDTAPESIEQESDLDQVIRSCPEIVITRRLYRSGESEYLLNASRVRLTDIQLLLAKANFGQKTYSVIGQGMVENFLNTSAAERKDFFDEATGVKQFQIKRDSALNKLEGSYENLQQVDMLLAEIKPRLKSLTRQVERLNRRSQLETELKSCQLSYYRQLFEEIDTKLNGYNTAYLEKEKVKLEKEKKATKLEEELNKIRQTDKTAEANNLQPQLQELYNAKNQLHKELAKINAELELGLEARGAFDLSWLSAKQGELQAEKEKAEKERIALNASEETRKEKELAADLAELGRELATYNEKLQTASRQISRQPSKEKSRQEINELIEDFLSRLEEISSLEDLMVIKKELSSAREEFSEKIRDFLTEENSEKLQEIREIQEKIIAISEKKQAAAMELAEERSRSSLRQERFKIAQEKEARIEKELEDVENKIARQKTPADIKETEAAKKSLQGKIDSLNEKISELEKEVGKLNRDKEQEKNQIFEYQRHLQNAQTEIGFLVDELNSLKVEATRQETRLEDLENNIRIDGLSLQDIKGHRLDGEMLAPEKAQKKIGELKNQLELIGGIDPETEKEYQETKERYDFLTNQVNDLEAAIKSLEEIIYELDLNIKGRFDSEFKLIAEKFNDYFKILFNGGQAKIAKIMTEDLEKEENKGATAPNGSAETNAGFTPAEVKIKTASEERLQKIKFLKKHNAVGLAGIDIQATPPGKKIQTVTMLSGGERALTAIALICAIISANPSPFVVLDEVDAALDEANSERLARILDDLSNKTQFIVITHNRASMRRASILYGVTMESDGVSRLLSVKLDEIKK